MFRGFFSGGVLGLIVSVLALGTASLVGDQPTGDRPPLAPQVQAPGLAEGSGRIVGDGARAVPGGASDPGGAPAPSETPEVAVPQTDSDLPETDTLSPGAPEAQIEEQGFVAPALDTTGPDTDVGNVPGVDAPVLPNPLARAPEPPAGEAAIEVISEPVEPSLPAASALRQPESAAAADGSAPGAVLVEPTLVDPAPANVEIAPEAATQTLPDAVIITGDAPAERPRAETESVNNQPIDPQSSESSTPSLAASEASPMVTSDAPVMAGPTAQEAPPVVAANDAPATVAAPAEATATPRISLQGGESTMPGGTETVRVIRPGIETAPADDAVAEAIPEPVPNMAAPALERHAATFENREDKPLMSIILIDDGALGASAVAAVRAVPFPVTVALDALAADAAPKMAAYRAAGIEVMALAALPEGAQPSDVEIALEAAFAALPDSIALLDAGAGGLQSDRSVTEQAMARLAHDGRGFITQPQGLNMALRSAEAIGVPASVIYRDLDSEGQDARVIRRFLDQAAFRARQQGGVVLVGRVRGDTLSALSLWGTANRAGQVTLAPVSAVLLDLE